MTDLLAALDVVALERLPDGSCRLLSSAPAWFIHLCPVAVRRQRFPLAAPGSYLEHFLLEAEAFWSQRGAGRLLSGPWTETDAEGQATHFEASAVSADGARLLFIQLLGPTYDRQQAILQKARDARLDHERLMRAEAALRQSEAQLAATLRQLEKSHDDLLAILNQLHLGSLMLDEQGRVAFVSRALQRLLDKRQDEILGQPWDCITPFAEEANAALRALVAQPASARARRPVRLDTPRGLRYWMEVEVQDDPRDPRRKFIFFDDVTEVHDLRRQVDQQAQFHDLVGHSDAMRQVYHLIGELARVDTTVLIEGETGTGKELVARAIHEASHRSAQPFVAVNCAGLTESLLSSQLFGHKRGAFTGAVSDHQGLFETAHGGTLFLDEIGDIPLSVQTHLLRVLQEREITRLGESRPRKIDVRILTATHRNLLEEVDKGTFRADLLYRIRVARATLPPLRERRPDIPLLIRTFLRQCRTTMGKAVQEVSHDAMRLLVAYAWPGNVRELRSAIEFATIRSRGGVIQAADLPPELAEGENTPQNQGEALVGDGKARLIAALEQARGNRMAAARLLGVSRATLYRWLDRYDIPRRARPG